jgi:hypothetical protein
VLLFANTCARCSVYLLYQYKSTNTDTGSCVLGVCYPTAGTNSEAQTVTGFFDQLAPVQVQELASVTISSVSAGSRHSLALSQGSS